MKVNGNKVKKVTLLMALLAPMIYLFGSLFEALKGANGEQVLAQPEYVQQWVEVDNFNKDGSLYRLYLDSSLDGIVEAKGSQGFVFPFSFNNVDYARMNCAIPVSDPTSTYINLTTSGGSINQVYRSGVARVALPWVFVSDSFIDSFLVYFGEYGHLDKLVYVPTSVVVESPSAYSDFLFSQFFTRNNFLAASGDNVINGTPDYGFAPAADMIRYIDSNMLHLANVEWGALVIGYVYYAFHVTIVFFMFELLMFFPHMIENIYEKFERGL